MLSKSKIKFITQLRQKKYRELHSMFLVEGSRNIIDFLQSKTTLIDLFATGNWIGNSQKHIANFEATVVSTNELKKISTLATPSEALAIFAIPDTTFNGNFETDNLTIALDNISDPGNLGTIIRTADWFGINQIYCSPNTVDAFNPKVVQATMGSLARVRIIYADLSKFLTLVQKQLPIFGAVLNGKAITEIAPQTNGIILIGSEAHGISNNLLPYISDKITIPSFNQNIVSHPESLNASIATAIICYALKK
ncbi:MAG: RNA methyltransferase [Bacteroidetes bacterium]|nr:RNA methyltransferase [Bacteroidota bacterium]MBL6944550.1 RNA methyltransferase [Bacteroidales bacterium]